MIWHLQLQTKKELLLSFIFCIGLATCVVSFIRLTVVLGRGSPDFTWYYVPLGAYSVFEPHGGILCTNLLIIWHMLRKYRASNCPTSVFPKTRDSSTRTIGSGSRRSRIIHALGIPTAERTQNESAARTIMDADGRPGAADFHRLESLDSQKPDRNIWTAVERLDSAEPDASGSSEEVLLKPDMKTVWKVRK